MLSPATTASFGLGRSCENGLSAHLSYSQYGVRPYEGWTLDFSWLLYHGAANGSTKDPYPSGPRTLASSTVAGPLCLQQNKPRPSEQSGTYEPQRPNQHKDATNHGFWNLPRLGPLNQNVGSSRLCGLWAPYYCTGHPSAEAGRTCLVDGTGPCIQPGDTVV